MAEALSLKPEHTKRFLFVDDEARHQLVVSKMFHNCGVHVDSRFAGYDGCLDAAFEIIDNWALDGHKVDLISSDFMLGHIDGNDALAELLQYINDTHGPEFLPDGFFLHSGDVPTTKDLGWGAPLVTLRNEFSAMHRSSKGTWSSDMASHATIRKWCNEHWGTRFLVEEPLPSADIVQAPVKMQKTPELLLRDVDNGKTTMSSALAAYKPDLHSTLFSQTNHPEPKTNALRVRFSDATGDPLCGLLALCKEDVLRIKAEKPGQPIILCIEKYDASTMALLPFVQGFMLLGWGRAHLKTLLQQHEMTGIMGFDADSAAEQHMRFKHTGNALELFVDKPDRDGYSERQMRYTLAAGNPVTLFSGKSDTGEPYGNLFFGAVKFDTTAHKHEAWYSAFLQGANDLRHQEPSVSIMGNADTPKQVSAALSHDADGIGLVRSEHMFYGERHLPTFQQALVTKISGNRENALHTLKQLQIADFKAIMASGGSDNPLTIRLLDAPLSEFLSPGHVAAMEKRVGDGNTRGVQFARQIPGLYEMQIRALYQATKSMGPDYTPRIMIPNVNTADDVLWVKNIIANVFGDTPYQLGTMVETLSAVDDIEAITAHSDFLSIGSNDLMSEITGGVTRHDTAAINQWMMANGITKNPFRFITEPLRNRMTNIIECARVVKPDIHISGCGGQMSTDPMAPKIAAQIGLDAISVAPKYLPAQIVNTGHFAAKTVIDRNRKTFEARLAAKTASGSAIAANAL